MAADDEVAGGQQEVDLDSAPMVERKVERTIRKDQAGKVKAMTDLAYAEETAQAREAATEVLRRAIAAEREEAGEDDDDADEDVTAEPAHSDVDDEPEVAPAKAEAKPADADQIERLGKLFEKQAREAHALRERERVVGARYAEVESFQKAKARALAGEPDEALKLLGLDYSKLTTTMLQRKPETEQERRVATLEAELASLKEGSQREAKDTGTQNDIRILTQSAEADPDRYGVTLADPEGITLAYDVVLKHHERTGEVMPVKEALDKVEAFLLDRAQRALAAKKQPLKGTQPRDSQAQPARTGKSNGNGSQTLTTQLPTVAERGTEDDGLRDPAYYRRQAERAFRRAREPQG